MPFDTVSRASDITDTLETHWCVGKVGSTPAPPMRGAVIARLGRAVAPQPRRAHYTVARTSKKGVTATVTPFFVHGLSPVVGGGLRRQTRLRPDILALAAPRRRPPAEKLVNKCSDGEPDDRERSEPHRSQRNNHLDHVSLPSFSPPSASTTLPVIGRGNPLGQ